MKPTVVALAFLVTCGGCTTFSLERHAIRQAASISDLRYRETMNNLAMIADDPSFLPAFSTFYAGTTDITDAATASSSTVWTRFFVKAPRTITILGSQTADVPLTRAVRLNWTLDPTVVPEKLIAMRAACQWVIFGEECADPEGLGMLKQYDPPDPAASKIADPPGVYFGVADKLLELPAGWLHKGNLRDVPCSACFKAHCRDTWVWVMPENLEGLTGLTLVLQEIARTEYDTTLFPSPITRSLVVDQTIPSETEDEKQKKKEDEFMSKLKKLPGMADVKQVKYEYTVYVDEDGFLTPGQNQPAIARKARKDSLGEDSKLRSIISASGKGP